MKKVVFPLSLAVVLTGCSHLPSFLWQEQVAKTNNAGDEHNVVTEQAQQQSPLSPAVEASVQFRDKYRELLLLNQQSQALLAKQHVAMKKELQPSMPEKNINYYVRGLMQSLVTNLQYVNASTPLAVTTFVPLEGDYNDSNLLGKQIAESFIHEVHKFGIPVVDFKTTDYIRVTPQGDFILSQDYLELKDSLPIRYVIAGTMAKHHGGYLINARIIGVESKAVVASAQKFIPLDVADALLLSAEKTVPLVKPEQSSSVSLVQGKEYQ